MRRSLLGLLPVLASLGFGCGGSGTTASTGGGGESATTVTGSRGPKVSSHMTRNVVSAPKTMSVNAVMEEMTRGRFRHIPVVQNGRLGGIISIGDVVKYRLAEIENDYRTLHEYIATA